jgi:Uma2 family endonuclease
MALFARFSPIGDTAKINEYREKEEHMGSMLAIQNTLIDDTIKPAIEWINGKAAQKLMPTDLHAILQLAFARCIDTWAKANGYKRGKVGTEWRFMIPPNSYETESLVPDVAFLSTYFDLPKGDRTYPKIPPDIAVEILSPGENANEVKSRRKFLLWWGVRLVLIVNPEERTVEAHESDEIFTTLTEDGILTSAAFPTLMIPLRDIFSELDEPA